MGSTDTMDKSQLRKENLRRTMEIIKMSIKQLADDLGKSYSYVRDLINDPSKSFGEKIAREIEDRLHLVPMALDFPLARTTPAHPLSPGPATVAHQTIRWGDMMTKEPEQLPTEFRIDLIDDAMSPEACVGWRVEMSRTMEPRFGDDVLVRLGNKQYHYRRYRQDPAGGWVAAALNSDFASFESVKDPAMHIVAVMAFVLRPRRAPP